MSRKEKGRTARLDGVRALIAAGDHGAGRREALRVAADAGATDDERAAALALADGLTPERGALLVGVAGAVFAAAVAAWVVLRG